MNLMYDAIKDKNQLLLDDLILHLGDLFPLLYDYKSTPQDSIWHAEGDVHIHTNMVLTELYKLDEYQKCNPDDKVTLVLSALFHDIAKPLVTKESFVERENRECVISPKHEIMGRDYLAYKLLELNLKSEIYHNILNLVAFHNMPKLLVVRNANKGEYIKHIHNINFRCDLMYILEKADMLGRICPDQKNQLDILDEYKMFCEDYKLMEFGCYSHVPSNIYIRDNGLRLLYENEIFTLEESESKLYNYKNKGQHSKVVLMCGVPASGKSSIIKEFYSDYNIISLDEIRKEIKDNDYSKTSEVINIAKERLKQHLRKNENVVYDATNYRKDFRDKIISLCYNYHAYVTIHIVMKKQNDLLKDNAKRENQVESDYILKQINKFQFPDNSECSNLILTIV
jgi:predicted kinase